MVTVIEIWSDKEKKEFAIRLSGYSVFKAVTNVKEKIYENIVTALPYLNDYEYDWAFVLRHWLNNHGFSEIAKRVVAVKGDMNK